MLARLTTKVVREPTVPDQPPAQISFIREGMLPNLELVPVTIDSKPIHSFYIRSRTKSTVAQETEEDTLATCESPIHE